MTERTRRIAVPLIAFVLSLVLLGLAAVYTLTPTGRDSVGAAVGGPFALVDHDGRAVTEQDFAGAPHLVFFGFTHCPDVCPTKLFEISEILRATGPAGRDLKALFITVDPERDTPDIMKSYVSSFDERIVGLTGSSQDVEAAVRAYRAYARKVPTEGDYTMEHTATVYVMGPGNRFLATLDTSQPPETAARDLMRRL